MSPIPEFRPSISARLTFWYGASFFLLLSLFVVFLYTSFHVGLHRDFDKQLLADMEQLNEAVQFSSEETFVITEKDLSSVPYRTTGAAGTYLRILSSTDEELFRSPNFEDEMRFIPVLSVEHRPGEVSHTWRDLATRTRYSRLNLPDGRLAGWLEATRFESTMHRELHRLLWLLVFGIVFGTASAIGIGYGMAKRALQPVSAITSAAREIGPDQPGRRLPAAFSGRDELTDLAETLNDLLARLDASLDRERRFREDAAHEMFTPITALQSEIDVALHRPRNEAYYRETLTTLGDHVKRMSLLVENLLVLSQAEGAALKSDMTTDVSRVVRDAVTGMGMMAGQSISVQCNLEPGIIGQIESDRLALVVENLLDNAVKYTRPGGVVMVSTHYIEFEAVITVRDDGIGFTEVDAKKLFDRFFRAGSREIRQTRGSGLGLSIVKAIVDASGGSITADSPGPNKGSTFEVRLPSVGLVVDA